MPKRDVASLRSTVTFRGISAAPHNLHALHCSRLLGKWAGIPVGEPGTSSLLQQALHKHGNTLAMVGLSSGKGGPHALGQYVLLLKHLARGFKAGHAETKRKWCVPAKLSDKAKNRAKGPLCIICRSRNSLPVGTVTFR